MEKIEKMKECPFYSQQIYKELSGGIEIKSPMETEQGFKVFPITNYYQLIKFIGYGKYINRTHGNVYFRG